MWFLKILYISTNNNYFNTIDQIKSSFNLNKFKIYEYDDEMCLFNSDKILIRVINYDKAPFNSIIKMGRFHKIFVDKDIELTEEEGQCIEALSNLLAIYDL